MIVNLCFHGVGVCAREREPGEAGYWVREDVFLGILDAAATCPGVRLTFDDGNRSDVEVALPALHERGLRATFFPLAGRLDDPASLAPDDLRALRDAGMSIGSHGWAHTTWRGLSDAEADRELVAARVALEEACGAGITQAALPLGDYDRSTLRHLRSSGYRTVFTSDRHPARRKAWMQARYSVTGRDTIESVAHLIHRRVSLRDARNVLAGGVKRIR